MTASGPVMRRTSQQPGIDTQLHRSIISSVGGDAMTIFAIIICAEICMIVRSLIYGHTWVWLIVLALTIVILACMEAT